MGPVVLPDLIAAFRGEPDGDVRAFLVEIVWQSREPSVIPFLGEALNDSDAAVWKQALDGLVSLGSPAALAALHAAAARQLPTRQRTEEFRCWLAEAVGQAESKIRGV